MESWAPRSTWRPRRRPSSFAAAFCIQASGTWSDENFQKTHVHSDLSSSAASTITLILLALCYRDAHGFCGSLFESGAPLYRFTISVQEQPGRLVVAWQMPRPSSFSGARKGLLRHLCFCILTWALEMTHCIDVPYLSGTLHFQIQVVDVHVFGPPRSEPGLEWKKAHVPYP